MKKNEIQNAPLVGGSDSTGLLDARTLLAVVLVGAIYVGWQYYMQQKYPDIYNKKEVTAEAMKADEKSPGVTPATATSQRTASTPEASAGLAAGSPESLIAYNSETLAFDLSSKGMGVKGFRILKYTTHEDKVIEIGHPEEKMLPLETRLMGRLEQLDFKIETVNPNMFIGRAQVGDLRVIKTMEIHPEKYLIDVKVTASGNDNRFVGLTTTLVDEVAQDTKSHFLMPQFQKQEFYIRTGDKDERTVFGDKNLDSVWTGVRIAGLGSQYFTQAIIDESGVIPEAKGHVNHQDRAAELILEYPVLNRGQNFELSYKAFVGPKSHELLTSVDENLARVVDFGFFNWIGRHILGMLKSFYKILGNWGLAVIFLTVVVRLLVLPLNIYSYKSMRVMQELQPQIQVLREKYKDDQQKQQQELMALMKERKANPVAGCLPMFLQFPIFFALYQVLGNSIELYKAPFGLWIHDLSLKDPYYILPVLMGITMFIQQKITPNTTMDPAQQKVMLFMPIIFTFFMASLPSGLTLYMLVGAVFGVAQQSYFLKQSKPRPGVA